MNTKRLFILFLTLFVSAVSTIGQTASVSPKPPAAEEKKKQAEEEKEKQLRREREIQNLVLTANNQPIEIAADVLFNALDAKLIKDQQKQRAIIEDLFRRASEAKEPFKMTYYGGNVDTRPGYRSSALDLNLDQLSIQLRAVKLMMTIDKLKARQMFRDIPDLKLLAQLCDHVLSYVISDYYKLLKDIVDQTFQPEERQRKQHIYFASTYIESMDSPAQIEPMISFLASVKVTPAEFSILLDSFIASLRKVGASPRGFALSMRDRLPGAIKYLIEAESKATNAETSQTSRAFRTYLAKQLSGTQCADSLMTGSKEKKHPLIEAVNVLFESPLTEEEIKPEKVDPAAKVFIYWKTPKLVKLMPEYAKLRFGAKDALSLEERNKQEWLQAFLKFLEQMDDWKPEDEETEADYLHQRSVLYYGLIQIAPPGPLLSNVLRSYALFLRDSKMQKESPAQWLHYLKLVLRISKELKGKDYDEFMNTLNNSGHPVFTLYSELDRLKSAAAQK